MDKGELRRRLVLARDSISDALALIDEPEQVLLDVPYMSQWGEGADERRGDCGPACIAMMAQHKWPDSTDINVDAAGWYCGQPTEGEGAGYTMHWQLRKGALHYGIPLRTRSKYVPPILTLDLIKEKLDAGLPSIALVHYGVLRDLTNDSGFTENQDQNFERGHWFLPVGYDNMGIYVHDPDYWRYRASDGTWIDKRPNGKFRFIPTRAFVSALEAVAPGCSVGNQGLVIA